MLAAAPSKATLAVDTLLGLLAFLFVGTKALFGLPMFGIFVVVLIAPRLNMPNLIGEYCC
jgi:hypothetical protein